MNSTCRLSTKQMWKAFCGYFQINLHIHSMQVFCQLIYITKLYRCLLTLLVVVTLSFGTLKSNWITDSGITISESESEIHNQKYHCATILHLSTGTNTGFCKCVQKKWNSTKLMNDQKNCQLSENVKHWTKSRGQSSSNRCQRTGVTKTTTKDSLVWLTHQRRQQPQVSNCCPICFTSQFDDHQMPGGLNKGYTR